MDEPAHRDLAMNAQPHSSQSTTRPSAGGIETVWQDFKYALRVFRAHRGVMFAAAGMLGLAIGLTTAMFTVVDALILRPVPFRNPDQLAHLWMGNERGGRTVVSPAVLRAWRESPAFSGAESATTSAAVLLEGDTVVSREIASVTPGIFDLLGGVRPVRGRLFDRMEGRRGERDGILVSEALWRSLYHGDPGLIGRAVTVNRERVTVVGILPANFRFPSAETMLWRPTQLDAPAEMARAFVRFAPGIARDDALRAATEGARAADAQNQTLRPWVYPVAGSRDRYTSRAVPLLAGGVALVFAVLCGNVCGLLLARFTVRRREFSMRAALGASRWRLVRQALVENAVLGAAGAVIGAALAWALVSLGRAVIPQPLLLQTLNPLDLDARALAATSCVGVAAALMSGLLPAWLGTRVEAGETLRVVDRGATETRGARMLANGVLIGEVALACTLLVGATLLTRSFINLSEADRGLRTSGVTTAWLSLSAAASDDAGRVAITRTLDDELRRLPGVKQVAWSYGLPPRGAMISFGNWWSDLPGASAVNMQLDRYVVSAEFFSLYGIPVLRGRSFSAADASRIVIVSEGLARKLWGAVDPIGRTFRSDDQTFEVVGVAADIHYPSMDSSLERLEFYHPYTSVVPTPMVSLRCEPGCPDAAVIRYRLGSTHPAVRVQDAGPVERAYAAELARPRAATVLAVVFAAIAVLAAAGGLFSVLSYAVARRRREFGIRTALGASRGDIRRVVFLDALAIGGSGLAVGSVLAIALARTLTSLQYGVTSTDPISWSVVLAVVTATILVASYVPAQNAVDADPMVLLRQE